MSQGDWSAKAANEAVMEAIFDALVSRNEKQNRQAYRLILSLWIDGQCRYGSDWDVYVAGILAEAIERGRVPKIAVPHNPPLSLRKVLGEARDIGMAIDELLPNVDRQRDAIARVARRFGISTATAKRRLRIWRSMKNAEDSLGSLSEGLWHWLGPESPTDPFRPMPVEPKRPPGDLPAHETISHSPLPTQQTGLPCMVCDRPIADSWVNLETDEKMAMCAECCTALREQKEESRATAG